MNRHLRARIVLEEARALGLDVEDLVAATTGDTRPMTVAAWIDEIALCSPAQSTPATSPPTPPPRSASPCARRADGGLSLAHPERDSLRRTCSDPRR